jgi:RNA polymerase sigma factor (sigma-70 family)
MSGATLRLRTDAQLLRRFRGGDDRAFDVLHGRHAEPIRRYVRGMLRGTAHDAEDATQDVFMRAFEALRRDARPVEVRPWLFRVAHNRCLDLRRKAAAGELPEVLVAPVSDEPAEVTETRDAVRALLRDIGRLPERQRSALLLREVGGLSHEAVADALEVSVGASKQLVARARVTLAEAAEARDAACADVRERLALAADAGARPDRVDRVHVKHCIECQVCAARLDRVHRDLSLIPAGGAGLLGLFASLGGGVATKTAATAACAVVCVGGATAVVEPSLVPWPPAHHEQRAEPPKTPKPKPKATAPAKAGIVAAEAPVVAPEPVRAQAAPKPAVKPARRTRRAQSADVAEVATPAAVQTPTPQVTPEPVAPAPAKAEPEPPPVKRETIDLADLEG